MGYFNPNGYTISHQELTAQEKAAIRVVMDGNGFRNPTAESSASLTTSTSSLTSSLNSVTFADVFAELTGAVATMNTNITSYSTHSNRLSGVNPDAQGPNFEPSLAGLYGVASAYNSVKESMEGGNKDNFYYVFESVLSTAKYTMQGAKSLIVNSIISFVNSNAGVSSGSYPTGFVDTKTAYVNQLNNAAAALSGYITSDNQNYASVLSYLQKFGLGSMALGSKKDPQFGGALISGVVGTPLLNEKLNFVINNPT